MVDGKPSESDVLDIVNGVVDPEIGRTLGELDMLKRVAIQNSSAVEVEVQLPTPAYPDRQRITNLVRSAIAERLPQAGSVHVEYSWKVRGKETGGKLGLRVKNVIAVGSGKGGVGKSTVAAALAYGLKESGAKVGLMDADVYGPSIPHLVGASGQPGAVERESGDGEVVTRIEPIEHDGLKLMSIGFMLQEDEAVLWRGPMLHKLLTQFLQDTDWGELDYLIIDMSPGTGDVALTLSQLLGLAGAVVVCTPQKVALLDAMKAISMFHHVKIPVLGVVENMTGDVFGRGGARQKAEEMEVPFLGEIPIESEIRIQSDEGRIAHLFHESSPVRPHLIRLCEAVAIQIAKQLLETQPMPTLEIL